MHFSSYTVVLRLKDLIIRRINLEGEEIFIDLCSLGEKSSLFLSGQIKISFHFRKENVNTFLSILRRT